MRLALFSATAPDYAILGATARSVLFYILLEVPLLAVEGLIIGGLGGEVRRAVLFVSDRFFHKPKVQ